MAFKKSGQKKQDDFIDATPNDINDSAKTRSKFDSLTPHSIQDTKPWQASAQGIAKFWSNYRRMLASSFQRMSRAEQESLLTKASIIVTMGVTVLGLMLFYNFIPLFVRVFIVPIAIFLAWWAGGKIVSVVIITRLSNFLNKE